MIRRLLIGSLFAAVLALPAATASAAPAGSPLALTPVGRMPFPERGFVIDLPQQVAGGSVHVIVRENGSVVSGVKLVPVASSGISYGTVLALDASDSMHGAPEAAAVSAAKSFVARRNQNQQIGVVTFNGSIDVLARPSASGAAVNAALAQAPALSYGTRIYDALTRSLVLLEHAHVSSGSIVLLSDGADLGSRSSLQSVLARAARDHVRVFTVGLRSGAFAPGTLQRIAAGTGGSFGQADSTSQLAAIYTALGGRLAGEELLSYRSTARPGTHVSVAISIGGVGSATTGYAVPTPSNLAPYHPSLLSRFLLSGASLALLALLVAALIAWVVVRALCYTPPSVVDRVRAFSTSDDARSDSKAVPVPRKKRARATDARSSAYGRYRARLATEFEIAEIKLSPHAYLLGTGLLTVAALIVLVMLSPALGLLAVLVPFFARGWASGKVDKVRATFADQLTSTLQLLASALRSGHSFSGALSVVVNESPEPSRREFLMVLSDNQLGVPAEDSLRRVAQRMGSREMEQVALLAELQRTAGGNSAEVLDVVVETIRERDDVRRLARTLTAQGRMSRWVISAVPVVLTGYLWLTQPAMIRPFVESSFGEVALVICALMTVAGSYWIKRIVEIRV